MNVPALQHTQASGSFTAGGVTYQAAQAGDDAAIRELLRDNDMDSWVRMSIEREPSFFLGENLMGQSSSVIARNTAPPNDVVGMYSMTMLPTHINGQVTDTAYMGALRVNPGYRHKLRILKNGFASARAISSIGSLPVFTSVASENFSARRLLEANLRGMPHYTPVGELETMGLSTRQGRSAGLLQAATPEDIPALVECYNANASSYQFSPVLTGDWLKSLNGDTGLHLSDFLLLKDGPSVRGCIAIWDQRAFKQIVAHGYRFPLNLLRGSYNMVARLSGKLSLPRPGKQLEQVFLSFLSLDAPVTDMAGQVIREALHIAGTRGARAGSLGLAAENPLGKVLRENLESSIYRTRIETIHWPDSPVTRLDGRPPQPEAGLL